MPCRSSATGLPAPACCALPLQVPYPFGAAGMEPAAHKLDEEVPPFRITLPLAPHAAASCYSRRSASSEGSTGGNRTAGEGRESCSSEGDGITAHSQEEQGQHQASAAGQQSQQAPRVGWWDEAAQRWSEDGVR